MKCNVLICVLFSVFVFVQKNALGQMEYSINFNRGRETICPENVAEKYHKGLRLCTSNHKRIAVDGQAIYSYTLMKKILIASTLELGFYRTKYNELHVYQGTSPIVIDSLQVFSDFPTIYNSGATTDMYLWGTRAGVGLKLSVYGIGIFMGERMNWTLQRSFGNKNISYVFSYMKKLGYSPKNFYYGFYYGFSYRFRKIELSYSLTKFHHPIYYLYETDSAFNNFNVKDNFMRRAQGPAYYSLFQTNELSLKFYF